jgi:hypothetical protein
VKITILVEGMTEKVFKPVLREFFESRLENRMPQLDMFCCKGRVPKNDDLKRTVESLLNKRPKPSGAVIALTDVYTGANDFLDASDAKQKMHQWVGPEDRFYPHAAQHDFEAWLLPYWPTIQKLAGHNRKAPAGEPETVNHNYPPSRHIERIFADGTCGRHYSKTRDALAILRGQNLAISASKCPELRAFLNTTRKLCSGTEI